MIRSTTCSWARQIAGSGLLGAAGVLACASAEAQAPDDDTWPDPVAADLFRRGRELVSQGDWVRGCEHFQTSLDRYRSASTLMNLARCREEEGKVATAWAMLHQARVLNRETPGEQRRASLDEVARRSIEELEARLPRLVIQVARGPSQAWARDSNGALPVGVSVPLDPGEHHISVGAPGWRTGTVHVQLTEGRTETVHIQLVRAPADSRTSRVAPTTARDTQQSAPATWVWIVGGAGIAAIGVGAAFGYDAKQQHDQLRRACGEDLVCDEMPSYDPAPTNDRKNRDIALAVGIGAAGITAVGTAAVAWLLSDKSAHPTHQTWVLEPLWGLRGGGWAWRF